jgi:cystathionine beta-lyase
MNIPGLAAGISDRTRLMLLSHPHNPVGRVWTEQELTELGHLCLDRQLLILSDEIHSDLVYKPARHRPLASLSHELACRTITFAAPSKTFNLAGLSTSYVIIPDEQLRQAYNREIDTAHLWLGNIFGAVALEAAYNQGEAWLEELLVYLSNNLDYLTGFIKEYIPEVQVINPEATYLVWLDMRQVKTGKLPLREFLITKARIGCNDGNTFGPGGEGFQRMNIACPLPVLKEALHRLRDAIKNK